MAVSKQKVITGSVVIGLIFALTIITTILVSSMGDTGAPDYADTQIAGEENLEDRVFKLEIQQPDGEKLNP